MNVSQPAKIEVDHWVELEFHVFKPAASVLRTNMKSEYVVDVIGDFLLALLSAPPRQDTNPVSPNGICIIKLGQRLSDDAWAYEHDCGNRELLRVVLSKTMGLVESRAIIPATQS